MANDLKIGSNYDIRFSNAIKTISEWRDTAIDYYTNNKQKFIPNLGERIYYYTTNDKTAFTYLVGDGETPLFVYNEDGTISDSANI